jgi:hypothetical protein
MCQCKTPPPVQGRRFVDAARRSWIGRSPLTIPFDTGKLLQKAGSINLAMGYSFT